MRRFDDEKGGTEGIWQKEAPSTVSWMEFLALAHGQNYSTNAKAVSFAVTSTLRVQYAGSGW